MDLLDLVWPKKCLGCGKTGKYVCEQCLVGMWEEEQICPGCRRNSRYGLRHEGCKNREYLDGLTCFWAYEGMAKKIIYEAKYKFYFDVLKILWENSTAQVNNQPEMAEIKEFLDRKPVVIPVPLYLGRMKWRGFNQAEIIGRAWGKQFGLGYEDKILFRIKDTGQQVGREKEERIEAMEGAFQVKFESKRPQDKLGNILLVDDVWTTGSTMQAAAKALKAAGTGKIWGMVLAR